MSVRMVNHASGGTFDADPQQVPHLRAAGWEVDPDQDTSGVEEWPDELQRFGGQPGVRIHHPETGGETEVAASAWPFWQSKGWEREDGDDRELAELTVEELKERIRAANKTREADDQLPVSGTKAKLLEQLSYPQDSDAGDEPAQDEGEG
jgi:hypothetical protein